MIEQIKGIVSDKSKNSITVLMGGVGLNVWTTSEIVNKIQLGESIQLITELVLRETEINLYGFEDKQEREMFRTLMKINGIGPKAAMATLSTLSLQDIYNAIKSKNYNCFTTVPGIGKKTAQKIIFDLQDSINFFEEYQLDPTITSVNSDLLDALVGLGYSVVEAQLSIQSLPEDTPPDLESRLRIALQYFS